MSTSCAFTVGLCPRGRVHPACAWAWRASRALWVVWRPGADATRWLTALLCWAVLPAALAQALTATPAERDWIARHGPVRVLVTRTAEPYYSVAPDAMLPQGYAIDLMGLIAERGGFEVQYVVVNTTGEGVEAVRAGRVDMTPIAAPNPERRLLLSFPGPLLDTELVIARRRDVGDTSAQQAFAGRRVAVAESHVPGELLAKAYLDADVRRYPSLRAALQAVSNGDAELAVGWAHDVVYAIESQLLLNLEVRREPQAARSFLGPAVSLREPLLHAVVARALQSITPAERSAIARRWLPRGVGARWGAASVTLSPAERDWLARHGDVRVGFDANFAPFSVGDALGRFDGLGADMLRLAAGKAGLRVVEQRGASFDEVFRSAREGELDVIVGMARNAERLADFDFVGPFNTSPSAMLMRVGDARVWREPEDIDGGRLGLLRTHFLIPQLRSRLPSLRLSEYDSQAAVLDALDRGEVDAAIGNAAVVGRLVGALYTGRLQFTGVVPDGDSELYFGVPRRSPELARLLRMGFEAITPSEATELQHRWLSVSVQPGLRWSEVLRWALPLGLAMLGVLAVMVVANRRLAAAHRGIQQAHDAEQAAHARERDAHEREREAHARERQTRDASEQAMAARGRFLAYLSHELRGTVAAVTSGAQLLRERDDPALRPRLLESLQHAGEQMRQLLESTLEHERTLAGGLMLHPAPQSLLAWWRQTTAPLLLAAEHKGLALHLAPPAADALLNFDGPRLGQVLGNLAHNAVKFTASGGVSVAGHWDGHWLELRVDDTGPGIAVAEQALVFEPYRQGQAGESALHGAGLGLAICRQIVQAMGGTLTLFSPPGGGCSFRVSVPLAPDGAPDADVGMAAPVLASVSGEGMSGNVR